MSIIMAGLVGDNVFLFLDYLLVLSKDIHVHEAKLSRILERLSDAGLTINPEKCIFFCQKIDYLGHTVDSDGISPNSAKVKDVLTFPTLREVKHVKPFFGFGGLLPPLHQRIHQDSRPTLKATDEGRRLHLVREQ